MKINVRIYIMLLVFIVFDGLLNQFLFMWKIIFLIWSIGGFVFNVNNEIFLMYLFIKVNGL